MNVRTWIAVHLEPLLLGVVILMLVLAAYFAVERADDRRGP
jgi:hypothetical protein